MWTFVCNRRGRQFRRAGGLPGPAAEAPLRRPAVGGNRVRPGFTLVETMLASILVAITIVAALQSVSATMMTQKKLADRARGEQLAEALMSEILTKLYQDLNNPLACGVESGENAADRRTYDDIDDYCGWSESPPANADGSLISGFAGWSRRVTVEYLQPNDWSRTQVGDGGARRVTVEVSNGSDIQVKLQAFRTRAWPGVDLEVESK